MVEEYKNAIKGEGIFVAKFEESVDLLKLVSSIGTPHSHNGNEKYVWDIKPIPGKTSGEVARSQTLEEFIFHTDCSFEYPPPSYVALYVIQKDRFGGGITRLVDFHDVVKRLDNHTKDILKTTFQVKVPNEFIKDAEYSQVPIMFGKNQIAYRRECIIDTLCAPDQLHALNSLDATIASLGNSHNLLLENGTVLFLDNTRYLHARTAVKDDSRHLQRVRYF